MPECEESRDIRRPSPVEISESATPLFFNKHVSRSDLHRASGLTSAVFEKILSASADEAPGFQSHVTLDPLQFGDGGVAIEGYNYVHLDLVLHFRPV
jgi:hypothetical protein